VAGALGGNPLPVGGRGADNVADVAGALPDRDASRTLVDQYLEDSTFQVPVSVLKSEPSVGHHGSPSIGLEQRDSRQSPEARARRQALLQLA